MFPFKIIDLTHQLDPFIPTWSGDCEFEVESIIDYHQCTTSTKFKVQKLKMNIGVGTHIDSPSHCFSSGKNVSALSLEELFAC